LTIAIGANDHKSPALASRVMDNDGLALAGEVERPGDGIRRSPDRKAAPAAAVEERANCKPPGVFARGQQRRQLC
jgi:hypothetical protein